MRLKRNLVAFAAAILSIQLLITTINDVKVQAASDSTTLQSWLKSRAGIQYNPGSQANQTAQLIMSTAITQFPFTTTKDYQLAQAFRNVQGWTDGQFHNYAKGTSNYLNTSASVSRWTGVFLNNFAGITATSGKAVVTDLLNFNINSTYLTDGTAASTGYTMLPQEAFQQSKLIGALNPPSDVEFQASGGFTQDAAKISAFRTALLQKKFETQDIWAPDIKGKTGMTGLYKVTSKTTGLPSYFLYMNEFVQSIGGTMVEVSNFNGLPGFTTDKDAYRGYTIYQMTPFPTFLKATAVTDYNLNGKKTAGFKITYQAYGYTGRYVTVRVGTKKSSDDLTLDPASSEQAADGGAKWVQPTGFGMVQGKWNPGKNSKYTGEVFISSEQILRLAGTSSKKVSLSLDDGYGRMDYLDFDISKIVTIKPSPSPTATPTPTPTPKPSPSPTPIPIKKIVTPPIKFKNIGEYDATAYWTAVKDPNFSHYTLKCSPKYNTNYKGTLASYQLNGLTPETKYTCKLEAFDRDGKSGGATTGSFTTLALKGPSGSGYWKDKGIIRQINSQKQSEKSIPKTGMDLSKYAGDEVKANANKYSPFFGEKIGVWGIPITKQVTYYWDFNYTRSVYDSCKYTNYNSKTKKYECSGGYINVTDTATDSCTIDYAAVGPDGWTNITTNPTGRTIKAVAGWNNTSTTMKVSAVSTKTCRGSDSRNPNPTRFTYYVPTLYESSPQQLLLDKGFSSVYNKILDEYQDLQLTIWSDAYSLSVKDGKTLTGVNGKTPIKFKQMWSKYSTMGAGN
ncbi:fibronectin type III domain-containing protein [Paenibacillus sp. URB8-2]|uniref:fibronectin type III domain-containing protein n=1 Tax=Paenibacillus sp. URB8-2 TaxID=2741301 RepID=UPI0015BFE78F|nr:fibronectin type III domain-containing protein [Paenibacillus sp. URB8-2]BCG56760.1 hypothetical protein PUR_01850 [Paenibacillus sp. URB8-2]